MMIQRVEVIRQYDVHTEEDDGTEAIKAAINGDADTTLTSVSARIITKESDIGR